MCNGIYHNLKRIYVDGNEDYAQVVRWCADCGAIVVDIDYDNRTKPGAIMKMKFPAYLLSLKQSKKNAKKIIDLQK